MPLTATEKVLLQQFGEETCAMIRTNIATKRDKRGRVARASGATEQAIRFEINEATGELKIWGPRHIFALEYGRKPTEKGGGDGVPLWERLRLWIDAKPIPVELTKRKDGKARTHRDGSLITIEDKKTSLAKFLAHRIHEKGTLRYQEGEVSGILNEVLNQERIQNLKKRIKDRIMDAVLNDLLLQATADGLR